MSKDGIDDIVSEPNPCFSCDKPGIDKIRDLLAKTNVERRRLRSEKSLLEKRLDTYRKLMGIPDAYSFLVEQVETFQQKYFESSNELREIVEENIELYNDVTNLQAKINELDKQNLELSEQLKTRRPTALIKKKKEEKKPANVLNEKDTKTYLKIIRNNCRTIDTNVGKYVKGQERSLGEIKKKLIAHYSGLKDDNPTTMFIHGPTGCGKTYSVEILNDMLFRNLPFQPQLLIINGGDYKARHEISKLKGSPPGYIGYGEDGKLVRHIKENPVFSLVLIDEVEKAHPTFFEYLLRPLDKGDMEDGKNNVHHLNKYVFFMTSNIGEHFAERKKSISGFTNKEDQVRVESRKSAIDSVVKSVFPPEFINRINAKVHFDFLTDEVTDLILDLEFNKINQRAFQEYKSEIDLTPRAREKLIELGFSRQYGARNLKRCLENHIQGEEKLIQLLSDNMFVIIDYNEKGFSYKGM